MPSLPVTTTYGIVTGRIITAVGDTPSDVDDLPDAVPATGTVTFTPKVNFVRNTSAKTVMVPRPVVTHLDGEGYLVLADGVTSFGGSRDIYLVAADNPYMDPQNWSYTVGFDVFGANGVPLELPSFDIVVNANSRVDLSELAPSVGQLVSVAAATALAAQAAASAAAAEAAAEAAANSGGGGGGGVAFAGTQIWRNAGFPEQTIAASTFTTVEFRQASAESNGGADLTWSDTNQTITVNTDGFYYLTANIDYNEAPTQETYLVISVTTSGSSFSIGPVIEQDVMTGNQFMRISGYNYLTAGSVLKVEAYNAKALTMNGGQQFRVVRIF